MSSVPASTVAGPELTDLVRAQLKAGHGAGNLVKWPKSKTFGIVAATPGRKGGKVGGNSPARVFGRPLRDLMVNVVEMDGVEIRIPHFLSSVLAWLKDHGLRTEGLFRKAGSAARQKAIRAEIEGAETFVMPEDSQALSALDAASLLKQWVRELPEPLIPTHVQEALVNVSKQTAGKVSEGERHGLLVLCTLLLPALHSSSLSCIMRFLKAVSGEAQHNKMDARSLAICFTPGLFTGEDRGDRLHHAKCATPGGGGPNHNFTSKIDIVEFFITNADQICVVDEAMLGALELGGVKSEATSFAESMSEDNLDGLDSEAAGGQGLGPAARRRVRKKKRRSGSLSRVISATMKGISKAISRSTTPSRVRSSSLHSLNTTPGNGLNDPHPTPGGAGGIPLDAITPKVTRGRSISIKNRFKNNRAAAGAATTKPDPVTPYRKQAPNPHPPRWNAVATTPGTPASLSGVVPNTDLSTESVSSMSGKTFDKPSSSNNKTFENDNGSFLAATAAVKTSRRSPAKGRRAVSKSSVSSADSFKRSSRLSVSGSPSSGGGIRVTKGTSPGRAGGSSRSPRSHGIGQSKRRSREMIKQLSTKQLEQVHPSVPRTQSLRRGQPNTFSVKPSPMKTDNGRRIKMSFKEGQLLNQPRITVTRPEQAVVDSPAMNTRLGQRKNRSVQDSLTNLRSDISSLIEQSFGQTGAVAKSPSSPCLGMMHPAALETSFAPNGVTATIPSSQVLTRAAMRRQSSAFEFGSVVRGGRGGKRPADLGVLPTAGTIGRQSSAFELAGSASNRHRPGPNRLVDPASADNVLQYMNASVKDLVKKLEGVDFRQQQAGAAAATSAAPVLRSRLRSADSSSTEKDKTGTEKKVEEQVTDEEDEEFKDAFDCFDSGGTEGWTDAKDFFSTPAGNGVFANVLGAAAADSGCKRSSIIKIREKGIVSRNVETFATTANPQKHMPPSNTGSNRQTLMGPPAAGAPTPQRRRQTTHVRTVPPPPAPGTTAGTPGRRLSARMGVASTRRTSGAGIPATAGAAAKPATASTATAAPVVTSTGGVQRRQTLTGIRTTVDRKRVRPASPATIPSSVKAATVPEQPKTPVMRAPRTPQNAQPIPKTPLSSARKAKRIEGRRHLTIAGFEGEMRSPLREKQNLTASVQRSKSAQTPSRQKFAENRLMLSSPYHVRGSPRLRQNKNDQENLPNGTPLSAKKQRRQLSERMPTPKELPMVLALSSPAPPPDLATRPRQSPRITTGY